MQQQWNNGCNSRLMTCATTVVYRCNSHCKHILIYSYDSVYSSNKPEAGYPYDAEGCYNPLPLRLCYQVYVHEAAITVPPTLSRNGERCTATATCFGMIFLRIILEKGFKQGIFQQFKTQNSIKL